MGSKSNNMGKITIQIPEDLEKEMRDYIAQRYGGVRGYLGGFIIDAIRDKLSREREE